MASHRRAAPSEPFCSRLLGGQICHFRGAGERSPSGSPCGSSGIRKMVRQRRKTTGSHGLPITLNRRAEPLCRRSALRRPFPQIARTPGTNPAAHTACGTCAPATFCRTNPCGTVIVKVFFRESLPARKLGAAPAAPRPPLRSPSFCRPRYCHATERTLACH